MPTSTQPTPSARPARRRRAASLAAGALACAGAATGVTAAGLALAAPASAASVPACTTADLSARVQGLDSGAGQRHADLVLTNTSARTCSLHGYGGLALLGAPGVGVPTDLQRQRATTGTPVLARGASAHSLLSWGAVAGDGEPTTGACEPTATSAVVTPPSQTSALLVPWSLGPVCEHGTITQQPYAAGTGA